MFILDIVVISYKKLFVTYYYFIPFLVKRLRSDYFIIL